MSGDLCVICGKGSHQPDAGGEYVGMRDVPCSCGEIHHVCFKCWVNPKCKVLPEAFSWDSHTWMEDASFKSCPKDVKVALRLME